MGKMLAILYWIILVLALLGWFAPATWPYGRYVGGGAQAVLFVIIGLRLFRVPLQ